jgi:hypothetical protein
MSDLSPLLCAQKGTSASRAAMLKPPNLLKEILSRVGVPGGCLAGQGRSKVSQAATLNRSKRNASRSRSGRSLVRLGKPMVPPSSRFRDSSIGPSFCPSSSRSELVLAVVELFSDAPTDLEPQIRCYCHISSVE